MAITTLTIGGTAIDLAHYPLGKLVAYSKDGIPSLSLYRRGGPLPGLPDPWLGQPVVLTINGTTYFQGDVVSASPHYDAIGWVVAYQCLGLRYRGNLVPLTDDNTGLDTAGFNLQPEDPSSIASRAGRTVGQILTAVLTMTTNATNLSNAGLGGYTSLSPPTLPATTVADLTALVVIPPCPVYVGGEKLIGALDAFLAQWAPNHTLWIDPATGTFRFLDLRTFGATGYGTTGAHAFTLGTDRVLPCPLSRDTSDCFPRVEVRGQPWTEPWLLSLSNGGLQEAFAHDGLTNAQAKATWKPSDFAQPGTAQNQGTCTCPSTTTVTVTSANAATTWGANFWDQTTTGRHGIITLAYPSGAGLTQYATRRVVANTALVAGGSSTLTLDLPLPITSYTTYTLFGLQGGASIVWRKYAATNSAVGAALQNFFPYPTPFVGAGGQSASLTSVPVGSVLWSSNGNSPYNEFPLPFTQDPSSGTFLFVKPTFEVANNAPPADVRVLAAVATGVNQVFAPADVGGSPQYAGTSHTVEGLARTLVVTVDQWRDPGQATAMAAYAADLLDSVKDAIVEGEITLLGLYEPALTMGLAVTVTGLGYTTGWENLSSSAGHPGLPVIAVELDWNASGPVDHTMRLRCSNRRAHNSATMFLKPARTGATWGGFEGFDIAEAARSLGVGQAWQGFLGPLAGVFKDAMTGALPQGVSEALGQQGAGIHEGLGTMGAGLSEGLGTLGAGLQGALGALAGPTPADEVAARGAEASEGALADLGDRAEDIVTGNNLRPARRHRFTPHTPEERARAESERMNVAAQRAALTGYDPLTGRDLVAESRAARAAHWADPQRLAAEQEARRATGYDPLTGRSSLEDWRRERDRKAKIEQDKAAEEARVREAGGYRAFDLGTGGD